MFLSLFRSKLAALGWFVLMCVLFFMPAEEFPHDHWTQVIHADKIVHVGLFLVLMIFCRTAFPKLTRYFLPTVLVLAGYGVAVEYIQLNFTDRSFEKMDMVADTAGALLGWLIFKPWLKALKGWEGYKKNKPL